MIKLKTKAEATAAVRKFFRLRDRFWELAKAQKEMAKIIEANDDKISSWNTPLKKKEESAKITKKLLNAHVKGSDKKYKIKMELIELNKAILEYQKRTKTKLDMSKYT